MQSTRKYKIRTVSYKKRNRPPLRSINTSSKTADTTLKVRCEYYDIVAIASNGTTVLKSNTGLFNRNYINIADVIAGSSSYVKYAGLFGKMRIDTLSLSCHSVQSVSSVGLPTQFLAFYPNFVSSSELANALGANDDSLLLHYNLARAQTRVYRFKKGYFSGPEGTGYGTDFDPGKLSNLPGQLSVKGAYGAWSVPESGSAPVFNVVVKILITFSEPLW